MTLDLSWDIIPGAPAKIKAISPRLVKSGTPFGIMFIPRIFDFAAATLPSESNDASPFLIDCGYEPRTSFDWTPMGGSLPRRNGLAVNEPRKLLSKWKWS